MKRHLKQLLSFVLIATLICGTFAGCGKTYKETYLTRGAFYALFIEQNGLSSTKYTEDEIASNLTYDLEAEILQECGLIDEEQTKKLDVPVSKEIVAQTCVRFMTTRIESKDIDIKDIKKCHDQQAIKDAVGMGLFETENGYFDALQKMTYDECLEAIDRMTEHELDDRYYVEAPAIDMDRAALFDVAEDDILSCDVITWEEYISMFPDTDASGMKSDDTAYDVASLSYVGNTDYDLINTASTKKTASMCYKIEVPYDVGKDYEVKELLIYDPFSGFNEKMDKMLRKSIPDLDKWDSWGAVIERKEYDSNANKFTLYLSEADLNKKIEGLSDGECEGSSAIKIDSDSFKPSDLLVKDGNIKVGDNDVSIEKYEDGYKITFNIKSSSKKPGKQYSTIPGYDNIFDIDFTAIFKIYDFRLKRNHFRDYVLGKDGSMSLTFNMDYEIRINPDDLKLSPENNGNGKAWSNLKRSHLRGGNSGGSPDIKLADLRIPLGYGVGIRVPLYAFLNLEGSASIEKFYSCGVTLKRINGHATNDWDITPREEGKADIQISAKAGLRVKPEVTFARANMADCEGRIGFSLVWKLNIYDGDSRQSSAIDNFLTKYDYCMDSEISLYLEYKFLSDESALGALLKGKLPKAQRDDLVSYYYTGAKRHTTPGWEWMLLYKGHKECTGEEWKTVEECSHGKQEDEVENIEVEAGTVALDAQTIVLHPYLCATVKIVKLPKKAKKIPYIKIESENNDIASVNSFNLEKGEIIISTNGVGNTTIFVDVYDGVNSKVKYSVKLYVIVSENGINSSYAPGIIPDEFFDGTACYDI